MCELLAKLHVQRLLLEQGGAYAARSHHRGSDSGSGEGESSLYVGEDHAPVAGPPLDRCVSRSGSPEPVGPLAADPRSLMRYKNEIDRERQKVLDELVKQAEQLNMGH